MLLHAHRWDLISVIIIGIIVLSWTISLIVKVRKNRSASLSNFGGAVSLKSKRFIDRY